MPRYELKLSSLMQDHKYLTGRGLRAFTRTSRLEQGSMVSTPLTEISGCLMTIGRATGSAATLGGDFLCRAFNFPALNKTTSFGTTRGDAPKKTLSASSANHAHDAPTPITASVVSERTSVQLVFSEVISARSVAWSKVQSRVVPVVLNRTAANVGAE